MKDHLSASIKPFYFTEDQRSELLRLLPSRTVKDKESASCFVEAVQRQVESWLSLDFKLFVTSPRDGKEKLERIEKAAKELHAAMDDIPPDIGAVLGADMITRLYCDPYAQEHPEITAKLKSFGHPNLLREDLLDELVRVLGESAACIASNLNVKSGPNNGRMIGLVAKLADSYGKCFQKEPASGNGSNFRKFLAELSGILGKYDWCLTDCLGKETVSTALVIREKVRKDWEQFNNGGN